MKTPGIYKITNTKTGHFYIGSSKNVSGRWAGHRWSLRNNKHGNIHLQRSWNRNGKNSFQFTLIESCFESDLLSREQHYIDSLKPQYNILKIAGRVTGYRHSDVTKKKQSKNRMVYPPDTGSDRFCSFCAKFVDKKHFGVSHRSRGTVETKRHCNPCLKLVHVKYRKKGKIRPHVNIVAKNENNSFSFKTIASAVRFLKSLGIEVSRTDFDRKINMNKFAFGYEWEKFNA